VRLRNPAPREPRKERIGGPRTREAAQTWGPAAREPWGAFKQPSLLRRLMRAVVLSSTLLMPSFGCSCPQSLLHIADALILFCTLVLAHC